MVFSKTTALVFWCCSFFLLCLGASQSSPFEICPSPQIEIQSGERHHEQSVAYNSITNEWTIVWIHNPVENETSIRSATINSSGVVTNSADVLTFAQLPNFKRVPVISYSPISNSFFVVFEYSTGDADTTIFDLGGVLLNSDGTPLGGILFFDITIGSSTRNQAPTLAYNSIQDNFLLVWEFDSPSNVTGNLTTQVSFRSAIFTPQGVMLSATLIDLFFEDDLEPDVAFDSLQNQFLLVWTRVFGMTTDIWGVALNASGSPIGQPFEITGLRTFDGVQNVTERSPKIAFSPDSGDFGIVFEVDLTEIGRNDTLIGFTTANSQQFTSPVQVLGETDILERNPVISHTTQSSDFVVVWESDTQIPSVESQIRGVIFDPSDLTPHTSFSISNPLSLDEHSPIVSTDNSQNQILIGWTSGPEFSSPGGRKRFQQQLGESISRQNPPPNSLRAALICPVTPVTSQSTSIPEGQGPQGLSTLEIVGIVLFVVSCFCLVVCIAGCIFVLNRTSALSSAASAPHAYVIDSHHHQFDMD